MSPGTIYILSGLYYLLTALFSLIVSKEFHLISKTVSSVINRRNFQPPASIFQPYLFF